MINLSDLDIYSQTIILYIIMYIENPIKKYNAKYWSDFALRYNIDDQILKSILKGELTLEKVCEQLGGLENEQLLNFHYTIIDDFFNYLVIVNGLEDISIKGDREALSNNISIYNNIGICISLLNTNISTRECKEKGYFSEEFNLLVDGIENILAITKILTSIENYTYEDDKEMLEILYRAYNEDIKICADVLILILSLQCIKFSPLVDRDTYKACEKIVRILSSILRNARVISIFNNIMYFDKMVKWDIRGARDQTTRIDLLYEYDNGDKYRMRFDLAHKGVNNFHFNISSLGGVEFVLLNEGTYSEVISINKLYINWFIEYGNNVYYLRENRKEEIYQAEHKELLELLKSNSHYSSEEFLDEEVVIIILDNWNQCLLNIGNILNYDKLDPLEYYLRRWAYIFVEDWFKCKKIGTTVEKKILKENIINYCHEKYDLDKGELNVLTTEEILQLLF